MAGWFELSKMMSVRFVKKRAMVNYPHQQAIYLKASAERASRRCVTTARKKNAMRKTASNGKFYFNLKPPIIKLSAPARCMPPRNLVKPIASVKVNGTSQTVKDNT